MNKYEQYLKSTKWYTKRKKILERDKCRCRVCGSRSDLNVHHLTYKRLYREWDRDLITVCQFHHLYLFHRDKTFLKYVDKLEKYLWIALAIFLLPKGL